ncbi:flavoprotein [Streptomyces sp. CRN 30]|uniref:flavoprotein n=1 Tax=Streptomyces sp. CRN 30 TaxID=3075613 RepID=UPI002A8254CB|nr:flavoprotein [Streptomyces sp. CRN 30]
MSGDPGDAAAAPSSAGLPSPELSAARLLLVGSGALGVAHLPFWASWLRQSYPDVELRILLTRSAERFVSPLALSAVSGTTVHRDTWTGHSRVGALHVELAEWADAVAVHPATLHFVARLAHGLADTPSLLALQCTRAVIGVAPSLPPGALDNPLVREQLKRLARRPNIVVAPTVPGHSATTGRLDAAVAEPLPALLARVEALRARLRPGGGGDG